MPLTCLTTMITMCLSSGLGTKPIVGFFLHLGQLLSTCVPFSLGASEDTLKGDVINWSVFIWCVCFTVTLTIFVGEFCGLRSCFPFSWDGFLCAHAFYFFIFCFSTTIILGTTYIKFLPPGSAQNRVITATASPSWLLYSMPLKRSASYPAWRHGLVQASLPRPAQEARELW